MTGGGAVVPFVGGCVPLTGGGAVVPLFGEVTGRPEGAADIALDSSAELAFPQMSVTPPADTDSDVGVAPCPNATYIVASPCPCWMPSTAMAAPSTPYTRTPSALTPHTASLNDTFRTLAPTSYPADDICGGVVSLYDMATFRSAAL